MRCFDFPLERLRHADGMGARRREARSVVSYVTTSGGTGGHGTMEGTARLVESLSCQRF